MTTEGNNKRLTEPESSSRLQQEIPRAGLLWGVVLDPDVLSQELLVIARVSTQVAVEHLQSMGHFVAPKVAGSRLLSVFLALEWPTNCFLDLLRSGLGSGESGRERTEW
ncbi:hypothetical protein E2C01_023574 [Portunus trituberculatus]|uniref:Uncharacterized protein n=1 Tax=Portunus trituberculatus TaxID=210409 RepID=A0A5B7EBH5_PORTR|nr:hypothetical protein [Portunus trituberculatus]